MYNQEFQKDKNMEHIVVVNQFFPLEPKRNNLMSWKEKDLYIYFIDFISSRKTFDFKYRY